MPLRRDILGLFAALPAGKFATWPRDAPPKDATARDITTRDVTGEAIIGLPTMIVAGPDGGRVDRIATQLAPLLARRLSPGTAIRRRGTGGIDGVTGANQFSTRASPDGETVLLVPGAAALAWLTGDTRAHFDTASWVPVMAGMSSGVLLGRLPEGGITQGARLRIAAELTGFDLPALLAVDLLGAVPVPVRGLRNDAAIRDALLQGHIDLAFLRDRLVPERVVALQRAGAAALFSLGAITEAGELARDPAFPALPDFAEYYKARRGAPPEGPLYPAWRAAASASQLDFALVLPQLTPASFVATWRQAGTAVADTVGWYPPGTFRVLPPAAATAFVTSTAAPPPAQLELRRWMAVRLDWRPA